MKKIVLLLMMLMPLMGFAQKQRMVYIIGKVYAQSTNMSLVGARVYLLDSKGCAVDSAKAEVMMMHGSNVTELPQFQINVPYSDEEYTIEATYPGYESAVTLLDFKKLGKRENIIDLPDIFLRRAPKQLGEVSVTASVVKFYNKGDTLVFNADAFQLADGSMLDALIKQLPGVELRDNGQIYVNGKFVESLLLNGREFIGTNNQLLLDNLGAYTVKDVAVYNKASRREEFLGKDLGEAMYVMDVRMKKEFLGTYLLNIEGGIGTSKRYMGRAFAMRSAPTSQIMIAANINNLNDARRPGENTNWKPENLESGTHKEKFFRADYNFNARNNSWEFNGNTIVKHSSADDDIYTNQIMFLPTADNYQYSFRGNHSKNLWMGTAGYFKRKYSKMMLDGSLTMQYVDMSNKNSIASATFISEQTNVTRSLLENLFSSASINPSSIVNRNLQLDSTANRTYRVFGKLWSHIKIPHTSDDLSVGVNADYTHDRPVRFNDQIINYGNTPNASHGAAQYFKNHPLHSLKLGAHANYTFYIGAIFSPEYRVQYAETEKDSRLYEIEHLADLGISGTLPADYENHYNPENSYFGTHRELKHEAGFRLIRSWGKVSMQIGPSLNIIHQSIDYAQGGDRVHKTRNSTYLNINLSNISYRIGEYRNQMGMRGFRHSFNLDLKANGRTPDMAWLVDIPYTADPLNIAVGAPKLKNEQSYGAALTWKFAPPTSQLMETVILSYDRIDNMLVRGYRYDSATGVRTIRSYNVGGNWTAGFQNILSKTIRKVTLSTTTGLNYGQTADMIGRDADPSRYAIHNMLLSELLSLQYSPARWVALTGKADLKWRRTTSEEAGFNTISALTSATGLTALFKLPARFQISTDATLYARRGYGSPELNTTDWVWNARLLWTTKNNRWLFTLDGFDLLKQLSSVVYDVNAQGRTVTYTNVLPRYVMLHVQYKINILPKARK